MISLHRVQRQLKKDEKKDEKKDGIDLIITSNNVFDRALRTVLTEQSMNDKEHFVDFFFWIIQIHRGFL